MRALFEDHPVLYDYMMLNQEENISTVDQLMAYHASGSYRPAEQSECLFLMTTLMIVLNLNPQGSVRVSQSPIFMKVVRDIKQYVSRVHHFDRDFITVCYLFCKEVMPYVDHDLMQNLIRRTIHNFDKLTPDQISYAVLNSFLLHDKDPKFRQMREDLFDRFENFIITNEATLLTGEKIGRKTAS